MLHLKDLEVNTTAKTELLFLRKVGTGAKDALRGDAKKSGTKVPHCKGKGNRRSPRGEL